MAWSLTGRLVCWLSHILKSLRAPGPLIVPFALSAWFSVNGQAAAVWIWKESVVSDYIYHGDCFPMLALSRFYATKNYLAIEKATLTRGELLARTRFKIKTIVPRIGIPIIISFSRGWLHDNSLTTCGTSFNDTFRISLSLTYHFLMRYWRCRIWICFFTILKSVVLNYFRWTHLGPLLLTWFNRNPSM